MSKGAAKTGLGPTALVAMEQFNTPEKIIIKDPLAYKFLPMGMKIFVLLMKFDGLRHWLENSAEKSIPGMWLGMLLRKRYIDDLIFDLDPTFKAVINLGAGFDTRLFRWENKLPIFELDQEINIKNKKKLVNKHFGVIPKNINLIGINFSKDDLMRQLKKNGYKISYQTFFIMEGVTQYLDEKGIQATFELLNKAEKNSQLIFTYVRRDFIDGKEMYGWSSAYKKFVKKGIWKFGLRPNEVTKFLRKYGWTVVEDLSFEELSKKIDVNNRGLEFTPVERIVLCKKEWIGSERNI